MELEYSLENTMERTYLVLKEKKYFEEEEIRKDYRSSMLLHNAIPGLLRAEKKDRFGQQQYCYDVSKLMSLESIYEKREMKEQEVRTLLESCIKMVKNLEEYLLDENQIIMDPKYIYVEPETGKAKFVYYPNYESDFRKGFQKLTDFLLAKIDHTQKKAVMLGYELYRYTRRTNFVIGQIEQLLIKEKEEDEVIEKEPVWTQQDITPVFSDTEVMMEAECEEEKEEKKRQPVRKKAGIIGSVLMMGIMFSCVLLPRVLHIYLLTGQQEMYFMAAGVMCGVAALMFTKSAKKEEAEREEFVL